MHSDTGEIHCEKAYEVISGLDIKHSHVVVLRTSKFVIYLSEYKIYLPREKKYI